MPMNRSRWFFLRAYLLVVLLVVVVGYFLEALLLQRHQQALQDREMGLVQGAFLYAEQVQLSRPSLTRAQLEEQLNRKLALPATVHLLQDFAAVEHEHAQLAGGAIIQLYDVTDQPLFYRRLAQSNRVLALGPAQEIVNDRARWVVPLFYGLIALAVFLWIRPLMRDLDALQRAAQAFGTQDFATRTDLPRGSWLLPLGEAFNSMAQRIQWLLQSHRELTHAVSHELRTPLARLRFSLEMLARDDDTERARRVFAMNEDIDELNALAEEMLGYAELEQGNLVAQIAPLDRGWLAQYVDYQNGHQPRVPLTLIFEPEPATVCADERLLRRALDNLVGNAQRFAQQRIEVGLRVEDGRCLLTVADDGPGIPPDQREAVLSAYVRLGKASGEGRTGFGLGLAIVKRIMDLHSGAIEIDGVRSGGALFTLSWPADATTGSA